jgi:hypothetical protein
VRYHLKKGDIKFNVNLLHQEAHAQGQTEGQGQGQGPKDGEGLQERWEWVPRPKYKRGATRTRQNIRHRRAHALLPHNKFGKRLRAKRLAGEF